MFFGGWGGVVKFIPLEEMGKGRAGRKKPCLLGLCFTGILLLYILCLSVILCERVLMEINSSQEAPE